MNEEYLKMALQKIPDKNILTIIAYKRSVQLSKHFSPMIKTEEKNNLNIALLEIANGLLTYEHEKDKQNEQQISESDDTKIESIKDQSQD